MFTEKFTGTVVPGETISCEVDGFTCVATIVYDDSSREPPWKECDGHGVVSTFNSYIDVEDQPNMRVLSRSNHRTHLYDMSASLALAMKDGWGCAERHEGESDVAFRMRAVEQDYEFLRGWCADEWTYIMVEVTASKEDVELGGATLCGIESCETDYINETANELLSEAIEAAKAKIAKLAGWTLVEA